MRRSLILLVALVALLSLHVGCTVIRKDAEGWSYTRVFQDANVENLELETSEGKVVIGKAGATVRDEALVGLVQLLQSVTPTPKR